MAHMVVATEVLTKDLQDEISSCDMSMRSMSNG